MKCKNAKLEPVFNKRLQSKFFTLYFFAIDNVSRSQAEPWGRKFPAILTPAIKAMIIGFGNGKILTLAISAKIGKRMIVTGVPARKADMNEEITNVINTAI